ncbi:hypothetical protein DRN85_05060 [Methanosarcinales archaeon]|nr:MAG: hypothetical protein DRN85_05060 [Methanosarcinales archaeon]
MSKRGDVEFLRDIQEAIRRIRSYIEDMSYNGFLKDLKTEDAVVRNIEIIGEAVKNLSLDFKEKHDKIEWKKIAGTRDKIIHFYFGVNWDIVWDIIKNRLPVLEEEIQRLIEKEFEGVR